MPVEFPYKRLGISSSTQLAGKMELILPLYEALKKRLDSGVAAVPESKL